MSHKKKSFIVITLVFLASCYLWTLFQALPDGKLYVYALDVGQGDAILIKTPEGKKVLIDGGPGNVVLERLNEELSFFENTIDMMILTHPHADHVDGLVEVLKRYEVKKVLFTGVECHYPTYEEFMRLIYEKEIPFGFSESDKDYLLEPNVYLDILYPIEPITGQEVKNLNNSSITLILVYGETRMLLTGDAEEEQEEEILMTAADISANIYKAGHHGSKTATSEIFFSSVRPEAVFICAGKDNHFGHPHEETMSLLERNEVEVRVTKDNGTIEYVSDGKNYKIQD